MRRGSQTVGLITLALAPLAAAVEAPKVNDSRLALRVFAEGPQFVTPVGLAVDDKNRVFVLGSHTDTPPRGYGGQKSDRIKLFEDADRDGRPEKVQVFAEGIEDGMNLAFSPEGRLYVVTSLAVYGLDDRDGDGICEGRSKV